MARDDSDFLLARALIGPPADPGAPPWGAELAAPMEAIARLAAELPHDILGFGGLNRAAADPALARAVAVSLRARLVDIASELERARDELAASRDAYLARELRRAGVVPGQKGLRLALTGERPIDGWLNVGAHASGVVTNLLWPLPFETGSASRVYFAMAIEHFSMGAAARILREICRVLQPGGVVRVVTQDTAQHLRAYSEEDHAFFRAQRRWWDLPDEERPMLQHVLAWTGAPRGPHDFFDHKYAYDRDSLEWLLRRAGFRLVEPSTYMGSRHADLRIDASSADAGAHHDRGYYGLFVDASV